MYHYAPENLAPDYILLGNHSASRAICTDKTFFFCSVAILCYHSTTSSMGVGRGLNRLHAGESSLESCPPCPSPPHQMDPHGPASSEVLCSIGLRPSSDSPSSRSLNNKGSASAAVHTEDLSAVAVSLNTLHFLLG